MKPDKLHDHLARFAAVALLAAAPIAHAGTTNFGNANGQWKITTNDNSITIEFTPDKDKVDCPKIGFIQTIKRIKIDGTTETVLKPPSTIKVIWAYRDDDTTSGGTNVDHVFCEKDPYYNGDDTQDHGDQGKAQGDGTAVMKATMSDAPFYADNGVMKAAGANMIRSEFETCAVCMSGPNAGTVYGCIKWKYERTKGDGTNGTATLISTGVEAQSQAHKDATTLFTTNHTDSGGTAQCPEDLPAGNCGNRFYNKKGPLVFHLNDDYEVRSADSGVKKGSKLKASSINTPVKKGDSLKACDYVLVPKGKRICFKRKTSGGTGGRDVSSIPLDATFTDLYTGSIETVESGQCVLEEHCGVAVRDCFENIVTGVAPVDTGDPETLILYTVDIDHISDLVTVANDPLASAEVQVVDVLNNPGFTHTLAPGDSLILPYPDLFEICADPDQLHLAGLPSEIQLEQPAQLDATLESNFIPLDGRPVSFSSLAGNVSFLTGDVAPDGLSSTVITDPDGLARVTLVGTAPGPDAVRAEAIGHPLVAFSILNVNEPPTVCAADINDDGTTDIYDFATLAAEFDQPATPGQGADLNADGAVNVLDFAIFADDFGCIQ